MSEWNDWCDMRYYGQHIEGCGRDKPANVTEGVAELVETFLRNANELEGDADLAWPHKIAIPGSVTRLGLAKDLRCAANHIEALESQHQADADEINRLTLERGELGLEKDEIESRLRMAVKYAQHLPGCRMRVAMGQGCVCGFSEALSTIKGSER